MWPSPHEEQVWDFLPPTCRCHHRSAAGGQSILGPVVLKGLSSALCSPERDTSAMSCNVMNTVGLKRLTHTTHTHAYQRVSESNETLILKDQISIPQFKQKTVF